MTSEEHNEWVQDMIDDVDWLPLKDFLEQLKEWPLPPEIEGQFTDMSHPLYEWIKYGHGWEPAITYYLT